MTQMTVAARAADLDADHAVALVADFTHMLGIKGGEETRPAGTGIKLVVGLEQRQRAQSTLVRAILLVVEQTAAERALGAVIEQHAAFLGRKSGSQAFALGAVQRRKVVTGSRNTHALAPLSLPANFWRSLATLGKATAAM